MEQLILATLIFKFCEVRSWLHAKMEAEQIVRDVDMELADYPED